MDNTIHYIYNKESKQYQCQYCQHNWMRRTPIGLVNTKCPKCGRKLITKF